jgi:hypothetical protein
VNNSKICVVLDPKNSGSKNNVKYGYDCPSGDRLDNIILTLMNNGRNIDGTSTMENVDKERNF